ncbi:hypothetical protein [Micromonospora tulbaghiae]|uniref:hypothetical protein n=1 Tax=Micromonospora tulbaghiae TaxID=479978 RepID=UPI0034005F8C
MTADNRYDPLTCPLPGCDADLHLRWDLSAALFREILDETQPITPADAWTAEWHVECEAGHRVLVPGPLRCPCGQDECTAECDDADVDSGDEMRTFRLADLARLRALLTP